MATSTIKLSTATGGYRSEIPVDSNLNDYTTAGAYVVKSDAIAAQITNMPRSASGRLIVIYNGNAANYVTQIYLPTTRVTRIYVRTKGDTTWSSWQTFALGTFEVHTGTVTTSSGGTASFANTYNTNEWACVSVFTTSAVSGLILTPYKYGDAANGRWGFKATLSGGGDAGSRDVSYVAIMYVYT